MAAASDTDRQEAIRSRLIRWAGFIHPLGEHERDPASANAPAMGPRAVTLAPSVGQATDVGGGISLIRVEDQRLVRLGRLALAVVSFCDRRFFYPILVTSLAADAVMVSSRSTVAHWIIASSRQPLADLVQATLGTLTGLSSTEAGRVERRLVRALAAPNLIEQLRALDAQASPTPVDDRYARVFRTPTSQELPQYLVDPEVPLHLRLDKAKIAASDPDATFPRAFVQQVQAAVSSFNASSRRQGLWTAEADYSWESFEPILCRVDSDLLLAKIFEFLNDVSERTGERLYAWVFSADSLAGFLGSTEIAAVRQAWEAMNTRATEENEHERFAEAMLLCMLLSHAEPSVGCGSARRRLGVRVVLVGRHSDGPRRSRSDLSPGGPGAIERGGGSPDAVRRVAVRDSVVPILVADSIDRRLSTPARHRRRTKFGDRCRRVDR